MGNPQPSPDEKLFRRDAVQRLDVSGHDFRRKGSVVVFKI
jgi:hypothetical protein